MSGNILPITNIVNVSVSESQTGVGNYNTSNVGLFTEEAYANSFGSLGYNIYLSPQQVGIDFGTSSKTYQMANAIFSQQPNILAGGGYLAVIPFVVAIQHLALSGIPASGTFTLTYNAVPTANINWNDTAAQIQTKLQAVPGLEEVTVTGSLASQSLNIKFFGQYGPQSLLTVGGAGLQTSAPASITITPTTATAGETMASAISRTEDLIQYFAVLTDVILSQADGLAAAAVIQALNKIQLLVSKTEADVEPGGYLDLLRSGGFTQSRGLYYGSEDALSAVLMMAAFCGRAFSVDFTGSNTTINMNLKDLTGVQPDPTIDQATKALCETAGVDIYANIGGVPKVLDFGANSFFDQVYNLRWFVGALQVAGFNYLAQSSTKIPQTETGMDGLKGAYRGICVQANTNQYSAPGTWNSATTFGKQSDFLQNISQVGYYIYSTPISQQSQADREDRIAPLVQIAIKEAGGINKTNVIVYVNP